MKTIYIKAKERDTDIVYTYLLSQADALKIFNSQHREDQYVPIENGQFCFMDVDKIMIKTIGAGGYLQRDEVIMQIKEQVFR